MLSFGKRGDFFRFGAGIGIQAVWAWPGPRGRSLNGNQGSMGVVCIITKRSGRGRYYMGGVKSGIKAVWAGSGLESVLRGRGQDCNQDCVGVAGDARAGHRLESGKCGRGLDQNDLQYGRGQI